MPKRRLFEVLEAYATVAEKNNLEEVDRLLFKTDQEAVSDSERKEIREYIESWGGYLKD